MIANPLTPEGLSKPHPDWWRVPAAGNPASYWLGKDKVMQCGGVQSTHQSQAGLLEEAGAWPPRQDVAWREKVMKCWAILGVVEILSVQSRVHNEWVLTGI